MARILHREGGVLVPGELMWLWSDYMHEEYRDLDCDFVFVNLWGGRVGRPLTYSNVDRIVEHTQLRVGFRFTAHQYADLCVMRYADQA